MAFIYTLAIPFMGIGPVVSSRFVYDTAHGWRGIYYMCVAINAIATICFLAFNHPPSFVTKHSRDNKSPLQTIVSFDHVGLVVFAAGLVVFLLGISGGGVLYQ